MTRRYGARATSAQLSAPGGRVAPPGGRPARGLWLAPKTTSVLRTSLVLALVTLSFPWTGADVRAAPARPFITVSGTRFVEGQRTFQFVGANLNVMHGPVSRSYAAATIAAAARDGLSVGRVWALGEGLPDTPRWKRKNFLFRAGPDGWQEEAFRHLDHVVAEAGKQGLRLIITLSNHWKDYGGVPMYLRWAAQLDMESYGYDDRFFNDPRCRRWFAEHVRRIVGRTNSITGVRYRDDPTIMAWELQNEMNGTPEAAPHRRRWVVDMARMIRAMDPNHMIVPGLIGYNLQLERDSWIAMNSLPEVSFCDQHIYPQEHLRSRGPENLRRYIDDRVQLAHHVIGKPIIFGEFGFADRGPPRIRAGLHRRFLERLFHDGASGALVWIYQPTLSWKRKFGIMIDRRRYHPLRRALARVARKIRRRAAVNRNPLLGRGQGTRPIAPTHASVTRSRRPIRSWRDDRKRSGRRVLWLPVDRFSKAWFEEAGSWDGGILVHAYGRRTGWLEYRFSGPGFVPSRIEIFARLSSEFPGRAGPPHGISAVKVTVDSVPVAELTVPPDDGVGVWHRIEVRDRTLLSRLARGAHRLRFIVEKGPRANGVAVYGRETPLNREPVEAPGPLRIVAHRP